MTVRERERGMTLPMVRIGLFKTEEFDEYGAAAVRWLWGVGVGLKETERAGSLEGEGRE